MLRLFKISWLVIATLLLFGTSLASARGPDFKRTTSNETDIPVNEATAIVLKAQQAMKKANALRLAHPLFNNHKFGDPASLKTILAPPLDYEQLVNGTIMRKRRTDVVLVNQTAGTVGDQAYTYSIPEELAMAARIVAESQPPELPIDDPSAIAAKIRAKYALKSPDTCAMPQAIIHPNGLYSHVDVSQNGAMEEMGSNETSMVRERAASTYWMANIAQNGASPFAPPGYKVWRNVMDYGAKGDGVTDDTAAINLATSSGGRCGLGCGSSTIYPATVYFPPGYYLVSSPLIQYYNTEYLGDPASLPYIIASAGFVGLGVITSDVYTGVTINGTDQEWYINQNNFLRSVKNFKIDVTRTPLDAQVCGIHWQVAQGTTLDNIDFYMSSAPGSTQSGIFMENGSGGMLSDLYFVGGRIGAYFGNQQFTSSHLVFTNCATALQIHWDWAWTMQDVIIESCGQGLVVVGGAGGVGSNGQSVGSVTLVDAVIANTPKGIVTTLLKENSTSLLLQNVGFFNVATAVSDVATGKTLLAGGDYVIVDSWGFGMVNDAKGKGSFINGAHIDVMNRSLSLTAEVSDARKSVLFTRRRPKYTDLGNSQLIDVKAYGALGDGKTDDSAVLNSILANAANMSSVVYFPFGVYIIKDTLKIPLGSRIIGQAWPQIMATGSRFEDASRPKVAIQVGQNGDKGVVEIQSMMFTVSGATAGAILVEWNIHEQAQGSAGMWDTHLRVGGAIGSSLQKSQCPKGTGKINKQCIAASLLLHLTPLSSAYFENVWAWVADHDLDVATQDQIDVYVGRGVLIESQGPTWLYGTASEHSVLYQYQLSGAQNVLMGMIQTEAPYYEPAPPAPSSFTTGAFPNDPIFNCSANSKTCGVAWAVRIIDSSTVYILGAGLYSWFSDYNQACLKTESCQDRAFQIEESYDIWIYNLATKAIIEMISPTRETPTYARDNQNGYLSSILAWLGGAQKTSGSRVFKGFQLYELDYWLTDMLLPSKCNNALVQVIKCDDKISGWTSAEYRGGDGNTTLTDSICDLGCGASLSSYYNTVAEACAGYNISGFPPTVPGGYVWQGYNETCLQDKSTGKYCNDIINGFTSIETIDQMPINELCSPCYIQRISMMQSSKYSLYNLFFQSALKRIYASCGVSGPTEIPPPLYEPPKPADICISGIRYTSLAGDTCDKISLAHNVSSASLFKGNSPALYNCSSIDADTSLCLPLQCEYTYKLQPADTCDSIQGTYSLAAGTVAKYNSWILFGCRNIQISSLTYGNILCLSPQGGKFTNRPLLPVVVAPADATGYTKMETPAPSNASLASGTTTHCGKWYVPVIGDSCAIICTQQHIPYQLFLTVNPSLSKNCDSSLVTGRASISINTTPRTQKKIVSGRNQGLPPIIFYSGPLTPLPFSHRCFHSLKNH